MAVDIAHGIDVLGTQAYVKGVEARKSYAAYQTALLDAQVAPYGAAARHQKAKDLLDESKKACAVQQSLANVADALLLKFGELHLGDTEFGRLGIETEDDQRWETYKPGLDGAIALSRALARHGPASAASTGDEVNVLVGLLTLGGPAAISKLLSASLPGLTEEAGAAAALDFLPKLGKLAESSTEVNGLRSLKGIWEGAALRLMSDRLTCRLARPARSLQTRTGPRVFF